MKNQPKITVFEPTFRVPKIDKNIGPEVLAALLAKFSRTEDGLEKILGDFGQLDEKDSQKMAERVLKFLDYGHASIGGLTSGIPVGFDKVSMWQPFFTFFFQPKQDGQETSTRYCDFKPEGLAHPQNLGVPSKFHQEWYEIQLEGFELSRIVNEYLDEKVKKDPSIAKIPSDANPKEKERMIRNYGFDRARYTIPMAGLTNYGIIMSGREWAETLKFIGAIPTLESRETAHHLQARLKKILPKLMNHANPTPHSATSVEDLIHRGAQYVRENGVSIQNNQYDVVTKVHLPQVSIEEFVNGKQLTSQQIQEAIDESYQGKLTRYDIPKGFVQKIKTEVLWKDMAIAEIRDMNRQRPCRKDILLAPTGMYMPQESIEALKEKGMFERFINYKTRRAKLIENLANSKNPASYLSVIALSDQMPFEMHSDAAHMTYVMELRTGRGVHFRYDKHTRDAFESFEKQLPGWTKHVQLGTGEPE
jgi:thymidylate synthase ThyX